MKVDPENPTSQVPYLKDRDTLGHFASKVVAQNKMEAYQQTNNCESLDGLPGLRAAMRKKDGRGRLLLKDVKALLARHRDITMVSVSMVLGMVMTVVLLQALGLTTVDLTGMRSYAKHYGLD